MSSVNNEMRIYKDRNIDAEEKKIIADFDAAWPEMQRGYKEIMKLVADNKNYEVERLMDEGSYVVKARRKPSLPFHDLNEFNRKSAAEANKANNVAASTASISLLISTTFVVVVALLLGLLLTRYLTWPVNKALVMIQEMEKGHLSQRIKLRRKDEIGILTRAMDSSLIIFKIRSKKGCNKYRKVILISRPQ